MILPSRPFRVEFEVIGSCNLKCKYCLAMPFRGEYPPLDRLLELFQRTQREVSPFEVLITGGEPFLRSDILDLITNAIGCFRVVGVNTNGTLFRSFREDELYRLKLLCRGEPVIQVSIDSLEAASNNSVRGATERVVEGMELLNEWGIPFNVGVVVSQANLRTLRSTVEQLADAFGCVRRINFMPLKPSQALGLNYRDLQVPRELFERVTAEASSGPIVRNRKNLYVSSGLDNSSETTLLDDYRFPTCLAGLTRIEVLPNGDVTPCGMIRSIVIGNVYRNSWKEITEKHRSRFLALSNHVMTQDQCAAINLQTIASPSVAPYATAGGMDPAGQIEGQARAPE